MGPSSLRLRRRSGQPPGGEPEPARLPAEFVIQVEGSHRGSAASGQADQTLAIVGPAEVFLPILLARIEED